MSMRVMVASLVTVRALGSDVTSPSASCSARGCTSGGVLLQRGGRLSEVRLAIEESHTLHTSSSLANMCNEASWPDKDHGLVCGECKVLVDRFSSFYKTCDGYCTAIGRQCLGAWEEQGDTCTVAFDMTCDQKISSSDAICQCTVEANTVDPSDGTATGQGVVVVTDHDSNSVTVCDETSWPDKDHGLVCGECKVLVDRFSSFYKTCDGYCAAIGRQCVGAWEEQGDTCTVAFDLTCDQEIASSDAICQCGEVGGDETEGSSDCYGYFSEVVTDEGSGVGEKIVATSASECEVACDGDERCNSFAFCPQWGCFLKDRPLRGDEPTRAFEGCQTFYKRPACQSTGTPLAASPTPATTAPEVATHPPSTNAPASGPVVIKCASYNLFWWNAFDQNAWKAQHIVDNIKDTLRADVLGLQECDEPDLIKQRTGYSVVSPFKGAQGVVAKPSLFAVVSSGSRDIQATGKWGPRYVTWAQLTHRPSGSTFWHFNTHWCVHSGRGHTCNAEKRFVGAKHMLATIQEMAGSAPVVITGDFNAHMNEAGPQWFVQNGFTLAATNWVDAIFFSTAHWQPRWTGIGSAAHSDHHPVVVELELIASR